MLKEVSPIKLLSDLSTWILKSKITFNGFWQYLNKSFGLYPPQKKLILQSYITLNIKVTLYVK